MTKVLFFIGLMIHFEAFAQVDNIKACGSGSPMEFVDECLFPNEDAKIVSCCDSRGAVICGPAQCICARGDAKIARMQKDSSVNLCESAVAQDLHYRIREAREIAASKSK